MIIQEHGDHLILIRQTDHAVLSGYFARELGNQGFAMPEPLESFQLAATEHDNGWNDGSSGRASTPSAFCPTASCPCPRRSTLISTNGESNAL